MEGGDLFVLGFGMIEEMDKRRKRGWGMIEVNAGFFCHLRFSLFCLFLCFCFCLALIEGN